MPQQLVWPHELIHVGEVIKLLSPVFLTSKGRPRIIAAGELLGGLDGVALGKQGGTHTQVCAARE